MPATQTSTRRSWNTCDQAVAELILRSVPYEDPFTADQAHDYVSATFPRAAVSPSAIRGALAYMIKLGKDIELNNERGTSRRGRPCKLYTKFLVL